MAARLIATNPACFQCESVVPGRGQLKGGVVGAAFHPLGRDVAIVILMIIGRPPITGTM